MNRSTPGKVARAERLERASPYARPAPSDQKIKRSSSLITFPGIRSLVSYITHPFARSPSSKGLPFTNMDVETDQKSESGSEDGWTGDASQQMQQGDAFEEEALANSRSRLEGKSKVAEKWSAMGEKAGGRRDLARRTLEVKAANGLDLPMKSPIMPGHLTPGDTPIVPIFGSSQPHLPSLGNTVSHLTSSLKRRLSPTKAERPIPRAIMPTFAPSTPAPYHPSTTSASSIALKAFIDAKDGQPLTPEDLKVIESLTDNARQESEVGSVRRSPQEVGGWAAGNFTPRPIKPLPSNYTPARPAGTAFGTPISGAGFSMGLSPAKSTTTPGRNATPGSVRYIGPGWSARRLHPQKKSNLKPLFKFDLGDEGIAKKRKIGEFEMGTGEDIPPVPPLPSSFSMPNFASSSKPSSSKPIEKEVPSSPAKKSDPVSIGKRRAADIMLDLINAEMVESTEKAAPPPFITNPYHPDAYTLVSDSRPNVQTTPASPARMGTPRRSILKLSTSSSTPLRGAAKRLEEAKNAAPTPARMTALEMLVERKSTNANEDEDRDAGHDTRSKGKGKAVRLQTPDMETEEESGEMEDQISSGEVEEEVEDNADVDMDSSPKIVEPEPFKPYTAPQLSSSTLPLPNSTPKSTFSFTPLSSSSTDGLQPAPAPKFTPSPLSQSVLPEEPKFNMGTSTPSITLTPFKSSKPKDFSSIYLSAKDAALAVAKDALPFFTFFVSSPKDNDTEETRRAKEEAMKRPIEKFEFKAAGEPVGSTPKSTSGPGWTCDLCMLQNPGTALEQCTICEAPRPGAAVSKPTPTPAIAPASSTMPGSGPWKCDLCSLSNPASALEKCTVCEAPKPSAAPAQKSGGGGGGFDWSAATGSKKAEGGSKGDWTCGTCSLKNPDSAKEKCTICEAPRG